MSKAEIKEIVVAYMKESIEAVISDCVGEILDECLPKKHMPCCDYYAEKDAFHISTTDDESLDHYMPFDEVINTFISDSTADIFIHNENREDAEQFIKKLRAGADLIESKIEPVAVK